MENLSKEKISVFGLGKLGCTMLACFASKGWDVIGMDINNDFVNKINEWISPIYEPGVGELIKKNKERIKATIHPEEAIRNTNVSFIIVPTPSTNEGSFSTKYVETVVAEIGSILRYKEDYHLIVVTSTVLPGDMVDIVKFLEKTSNKKVNQNFGVCYNPDFIALGNVIHDFLNPEMVLIGESDKKAGDILESIHRKLVDNNPNIHRMNFYNAELSKIALNSYCTLKITFANELAKICERMPGGDVESVTSAIGDDSRIGHKYFKGGLSFGGPCFPRDNRAIVHSAARFGCELKLSELTDKLNNFHRNERIPGLIMDILKIENCNKLSILGLTYKPDTTLVEESAAISIVNQLLKKNVYIKIYDPAGIEEAKQIFSANENITFSSSILECIKDTCLCFIATPWKDFRSISKNDFINNMKKPIVLDAWSLYSFTEDDGVYYKQIGKELL